MTDRRTAILAEVDARLRTSAGTLRSAVEDAIEQAPPLPRRPPGRSRLRMWLAAAVVVLVVGGAAVLARQAPDETGRAVAGGDNYLIAGWLPDGFELVIVQRYPDQPSTLGLTYGRSSSADGQISVIQGPGDEDRLGALPVAGSAEPERTEVRGRDAVRAQEGPNTALQWVERPGLIVTVVAEAMTGDELDHFVEALRAARHGEIDDALRRYGQSVRLGGLAEGEILIADGENAAGPWELIASDDVEQYGITLRDAAGGSSVVGMEKGAPTTSTSSGLRDTRAAAERCSGWWARAWRT
jgi:hypothetical protein